MQEHFGNTMNLARIKLMTYVINTFCIVQTVSLHKLVATTAFNRVNILKIILAIR